MNPLHFDIGMTASAPTGGADLVVPCRSGLAS
jgi:hypothetical protein